ncbi:MAG: hypothetical protein R3E11_05115 [Sphingobium sp.]|nr:hypothetical protein [Sphingobium sp.]MCP5398874.1 hypothetical protein [Sphingomonas sp.]
MAVALAWGIGYVSGGLNKSEEQGYQHYRYAPDDEKAATAALSDSTQSIEYRTPCTNPKGHDESDLCAQWKAAQAAQVGAEWTQIAGIAAVFGAIGLIITLGFNLKAWEAGREANDIARRALEAQGPDLRVKMTTRDGTGLAKGFIIENLGATNPESLAYVENGALNRKSRR